MVLRKMFSYEHYCDKYGDGCYGSNNGYGNITLVKTPFKGITFLSVLLCFILFCFVFVLFCFVFSFNMKVTIYLVLQSHETIQDSLKRVSINIQ